MHREQLRADLDAATRRARSCSSRLGSTGTLVSASTRSSGRTGAGWRASSRQGQLVAAQSETHPVAAVEAEERAARARLVDGGRRSRA